MKASFVFLPLWLFLSLQLGAQQLAYQERVAGNVSAQFRSGAGPSKPLVGLPGHVPMTEGAVFLWADFKADPWKGVPLYLVNATNQDRVFDSQDHDLYFKLEYKDEEGVWRRAQAHLSSWCGNSYYPVSLPARHYFEFRGYRPSKGTEKVVRYSNQRQKLRSDEGPGVITEEDLWAVAHDSLTEAEVPHELKSAIRIGANSAPLDEAALAGKTAALRALSWLPRNEPLMEQMRAFQAWVESSAHGTAREALLKEADAFFKRADEPKLDRTELLRMCIRVIGRKEKTDPGMTADTAWLLLGLAFPVWSNDLSPEASVIPMDEWRTIIGPAAELLKHSSASHEDVSVAARSLSMAWIVDCVVPNPQLEEWLLSSSARLRGIGAEALARRSQFARLVEIGKLRPGPEQIVILKALTRLKNRPGGLVEGFERVRQPDFSTDEPDFWRHCAATMPLETAGALWCYDFIQSGPPFNRLIHDPLREFWKREAASATTPRMLPDHGYKHRLALDLLQSWRLDEDDDIFDALLKHSGYIEQESMHFDGVRECVITRKFLIRESAKRALLSRHRPVPSDLVTEEVVSRTPVPEAKPEEASKGTAPPATKRRDLIPLPKDP